MDRGAARSRKRAAQGSKPNPTQSAVLEPGPSTPSTSTNQRGESSGRASHVERGGAPQRGRGKRPFGTRDGRQDRPSKKTDRSATGVTDGPKEGLPRGPRHNPNNDPNQYKPKAIRTSAALIYSQSAFSIPPSSETLKTVRRVDLSGSGCTDVSWLHGTEVTWLSVAGCQIQDGWEAIGSLQNLSVVSHSPNLSSLPSTLASLPHLSKFTFSHCPRLTASSLPDLSALPLLRDVKMNNLPQLTSLPPHIVSWGKGDLSQIKRAKEGDEDSNADAIGGDSFSKRGDGLEVLDLGNCSLTFASVSTLFGLSTNPVSAKTSSKKKASTITFPHLRSLSLHSNPLATTHPNYVDLLQQSPDLPNLQIIDAKRVVERKRKGEISESKSDKKARERKEGKMKPSGANVGSSGKMRSWGAEKKDGADEKEEESAAGASGNEGVGENVEVTDTARPKRDQERSEKQDKKERREKDRSKGKRKTRDEEDEGKVVNALKKRRHEASQDRPRHKHASPPVPASVAQKTPAQTTSESIDRIRSKAKPVELPVVAPQNDQERQKNAHAQATAVVGVVEVKNGEEVELTSKKRKKLKSKLNKGAQVSGGVDLKELFGKKHKATGEAETDVGTADNGIGHGSGWGGADEGDSGLGLGVGGW